MKSKLKDCRSSKINKVIILTIVIVCIMLIFGAIVEHVLLFMDSNTYKAPGKTVKINDYKMHIFTTGKGKKTVVFLHGWGNTSPVADFSRVYDYITDDAEVAVVERAGYGWSSSTSGSRDADTLAKETHQGLKEAGIKPPYIVVGHSLASLEVIRFMQLYGSEAEGALILDGGGPEYYSKYPPHMSTFDKITPFIRETGIARLLFSTTKLEDNLIANGKLSLLPKIKELHYSTQDLYRSMALRHGADSDMANEFRDVQKGIDIIVKNKSQLSIPLIVLTAGNTAEKDIRWEQVQQRMAHDYSIYGYQETITGVGHDIHIEDPEKVAQKIKLLLNR